MKRLNITQVETLRLERGFSRTELAKRSGITGAALSLLYSRPERSPTLRTISGLADALEVDLSEIIEEIEDEEEEAAA